MKEVFVFTLLILFVSSAQASDSLNIKIETPDYRLFYSEKDATASAILEYVETGIKKVSAALKRNFKERVDVYVFPDRKYLDQQWQQAWGMPSFQSQCWMVGSGVQHRLDLLSPSIWEEQACEHDANDHRGIRLLVYHELVHVLHSDYNRSPAFDDINNIDWFVEGLATYISGQLDEDRLSRMKSFVDRTGGPAALSEFWKGQNKYGLAGSMVAYINQQYGREVLSELMEFNDVQDILDKLNITEEELIRSWKASLK